MATSFTGGRSHSTRREPPTMGKRLVNFITCGCESSAPFLNLQSRARTHAVLVIGLYELLGTPTTSLLEPPGPLFICKSPELVRIRENLIPEYYSKYPNKQKLSGLLSYCNVNLKKTVSSFIKKLNDVLWNINVSFLFILFYSKLDNVNIFYVFHILWNIVVLYLLYLFISSFHV